MTEQYAIECRQITKVFGSVVANDKIDLTVRYGEIMALLGENGSGKSTLTNMLTGIYSIGSGTFILDGKEIHPFRYLPPRCRFDSGWRKRSLHKFAGRFEKFRNRYDSSAFQTGGSVQCDG